MPRWLVGQLDNTFRPGGRENNKEISNDAKTKVPLCESLGSNLGLNTQNITKIGLMYKVALFYTLLGCTEFLILATIHQKLPKVQRTWKLSMFYSYIMPNKLSPDEVMQWSESGVIETTKKAESKTWRLLRKNHGAGRVSWEIWISNSLYLIYMT